MAFAELYCKPTGSNLNGGGLASGLEPANAAAYTCTNSNWNGTDTFTPTDGSTPANTVTVGDFASVFLDAATVAVYIARVEAVAPGVNGAITLSTGSLVGTAPASGATGRTIKVGGAWKGPNAAEQFPFNFIAGTLINLAGNMPRVNLKAATYSITAAINHTTAGAVKFQGYTTTPGDGGRFTIEGPATGASFILLTLGAPETTVEDAIVQINGDSGTSGGISISSETMLRRVCVNSVRGIGVNAAGAAAFVIECEAYACNQSNTANTAGIRLGIAGSVAIRCISHDNVGSNSSGFSFSANGAAINCIADTNGAAGFLLNSIGGASLFGCDAYNNGGAGADMQNGSGSNFIIENCNFIKNTGWGVDGTNGFGFRGGYVVNCGFGSGTQANVAGTTTALSGMTETGSITYPANVTPWVDPANGDFRVYLSAAKGAGRGSFLQTATGYAGTVAYPDVGAAQHVDAVLPGREGLTQVGRLPGRV